ncbi:MAG: restriction endonuclease subunit S [Lachnospiraceae bacterium]|nr:restriction endonuclease subunit S [Lachnospiraceae bacterium]
MTHNATIAHYTITQITDTPIPLPSILEQEKIVEILDHFEMLTKSISEGLPAEIKMRHQQYEYYRDKLLSFERI